ncbi:MAG: DNA-3-methyladenine glycosylase I [Deltaproteobacteria bacterium]|nr:DNA-3-methyladenine glycosylase I [Deltaproteobacteria bacterium]
MITRCEWVWYDPLLTEYHDREWGVPVHDDKRLFEFLVLDAFQAGLSWSIILRKRENFRRAFSDFNPLKIAKYKKSKIDGLLQDSGIIRNRLKIESTVSNANAFLNVQKEFGTFDKYIWQFVNYRTIRNRWNSIKELPAKTEESALMSRDLKKRGFRFVGSTVCYAFMQAAGMVNDHVINCFRYKELR